MELLQQKQYLICVLFRSPAQQRRDLSSIIAASPVMMEHLIRPESFVGKERDKIEYDFQIPGPPDSLLEYV
jgi:hypothetical protein